MVYDTQKVEALHMIMKQMILSGVIPNRFMPRSGK